MTQNSMRLQWTNDEVDKRLHDIMKAIHNQCVRFGEQDGLHQLRGRRQHRRLPQSGRGDAGPGIGVRADTEQRPVRASGNGRNVGGCSSPASQ